MNSQLISVVVPCFGESTALRGLYEAVSRSLETTDVDWELILVDDGSQDDTWDIITELADRSENVRGRRFSRNFGKDAALIAGIEIAKGDAVITMDADQQHPPALLPKMIEVWQGGADVVGCVKTNRAGQSPLARKASRMFNRTFLSLTGFSLQEATDFKLMSRKAVSVLGDVRERNFFFRGAVAWTGLETQTVLFEVEDRVEGQSKFRMWSLVKLAVLGITSFSSRPLHFVTFTGAVFGFLSLILAAQTMVRFFNGQAAEGFTTVILLLLIIGTMILLGLGIIGEYIARIYEEVRSRPRYVVAEDR